MTNEGVKKNRFSIQMISYIGMLTALEIILNRFLSINAWNIKIGFSFVPIVIAAVFFGPLAGGIVGALGDALGAILFPIGPYFPGFTATAFVTGFIFGLFLHKKQTIPRIAGAVLINQLIFSFLVNSLWISILYGSPFVPLLATRIVQVIIVGAFQFVGISVVTKVAKGVSLKRQIART